MQQLRFLKGKVVTQKQFDRAVRIQNIKNRIKKFFS